MLNSTSVCCLSWSVVVVVVLVSVSVQSTMSQQPTPFPCTATQDTILRHYSSAGVTVPTDHVSLSKIRCYKPSCKNFLNEHAGNRVPVLPKYAGVIDYDTLSSAAANSYSGGGGHSYSGGDSRDPSLSPERSGPTRGARSTDVSAPTVKKEKEKKKRRSSDEKDKKNDKKKKRSSRNEDEEEERLIQRDAADLPRHKRDSAEKSKVTSAADGAKKKKKVVVVDPKEDSPSEAEEVSGSDDDSDDDDDDNDEEEVEPGDYDFVDNDDRFEARRSHRDDPPIPTPLSSSIRRPHAHSSSSSRPVKGGEKNVNFSSSTKKGSSVPSKLSQTSSTVRVTELRSAEIAEFIAPGAYDEWSQSVPQYVGSIPLDHTPAPDDEDWYVTPEDCITTYHPGGECRILPYYGCPMARRNKEFITALAERNNLYPNDPGVLSMLVRIVMEVRTLQAVVDTLSTDVKKYHNAEKGTLLAVSVGDSWTSHEARMERLNYSLDWENSHFAIEECRRVLMTFARVTYSVLWVHYSANKVTLYGIDEEIFPDAAKQASSSSSGEGPAVDNDDSTGGGRGGRGGGSSGRGGRGGRGKGGKGQDPPGPTAPGGARGRGRNNKRGGGASEQLTGVVSQVKGSQVTVWQPPSLSYPAGWVTEFNRITTMTHSTLLFRVLSPIIKDPIWLYSLTDPKVLAIRAFMEKYGAYDCGRTHHLLATERLVLRQLCPARQQDYFIRMDHTIITVRDVQEQYMIVCPICTIPYSLHAPRKSCELHQDQIIKLPKAVKSSAPLCSHCGLRVSAHKGSMPSMNMSHLPVTTMSTLLPPLSAYTLRGDRSASDPGRLVTSLRSHSRTTATLVRVDPRIAPRPSLQQQDGLQVCTMTLSVLTDGSATFCTKEAAVERVLADVELIRLYTQLDGITDEWSIEEYLDDAFEDDAESSIELAVLQATLVSSQLEAKVVPVASEEPVWQGLDEAITLSLQHRYIVKEFVSPSGISLSDYTKEHDVWRVLTPLPSPAFCYELIQHELLPNYGVLSDMGECEPELNETCEMMPSSSSSSSSSSSNAGLYPCNFYVEEILTPGSTSRYNCMGCGNKVALGRHPRRPTQETDIDRVNRDYVNSIRRYKMPSQSEFPQFRDGNDPTLHVEAVNDKMKLWDVPEVKKNAIFAGTLPLVTKRWWDKVCEDENLTWEELMEMFVEHTQHHLRPEKLRDELDGLKQKPMQTVSNYCSKYRYLATQLKVPANDKAHIDRMVRNLLHNVRSSMRMAYATQRQISASAGTPLPLEQQYPTFDIAEQLAMTAEHAIAMNNSNQKEADSLPRERRGNRARARTRGVKGDEDSSTAAQDDDHQESSVAAARRLEMDVKTNAPKQAGNKKAPKRKAPDDKKARAPSAGADRREFTIPPIRYYNDNKAAHKCGLCNNVGHHVQECKKNLKKCSQCGKPGHMLVKCADWIAKLKEKFQKRAKSSRIRFWDGSAYAGGSLFVTLRMQGELKSLTHVLADSGAEFTFISKEVAEASGKTIRPPPAGEPQELAGASRDFQGVKRIGYIYLVLTVHFPVHMHLSPVQFTKKCEVVNCEEDCVLGMDTLPTLFPDDLSLQTTKGFSPITKPPTNVVFLDDENDDEGDDDAAGSSDAATTSD